MSVSFAQIEAVLGIIAKASPGAAAFVTNLASAVKLQPKPTTPLPAPIPAVPSLPTITANGEITEIVSFSQELLQIEQDIAAVFQQQSSTTPVQPAQPPTPAQPTT